MLVCLIILCSKHIYLVWLVSVLIMQATWHRKHYRNQYSGKHYLLFLFTLCWNFRLAYKTDKSCIICNMIIGVVVLNLFDSDKRTKGTKPNRIVLQTKLRDFTFSTQRHRAETYFEALHACHLLGTSILVLKRFFWLTTGFSLFFLWYNHQNHDRGCKAVPKLWYHKIRKIELQISRFLQSMQALHVC